MKGAHSNAHSNAKHSNAHSHSLQPCTIGRPTTKCVLLCKRVEPVHEGQVEPVHEDRSATNEHRAQVGS